MNEAYQPDPITRLVRACKPHMSLQPDDPRYVNFDKARSGYLIQSLIRKIQRADCPEHILFAGHRGIGKTSELYRIKYELENPSGSTPPFVTLYIDATKNLDSNDLDFPDLLVLLAAETQRQLKEANIPGFDATSVYFKRLWDDLKNLLKGHVELRNVEVDVPFGSLALEIRNRQSQRSVLREKIESFSTDLISALNSFFLEANTAIKKQGKGGLVLIVDGLDKISRRRFEDGSNSHDRLFIDRAEQLNGLETHIIYTIPISMCYSTRSAVLEQTFGEFNTPISMIKIRGENMENPTPDTVGMQKMKEMLEKRCHYAEVGFDDAFADEEVWQDLCEMSGGHPRYLLIMLCSAANLLEELPITLSAVKRAVQDNANSLLREVPDRYWKNLHHFKTPQDDIPKDEDHQEMLFLLHIFEYMNGRPWYEVNPVLKTLVRFHAEASR